MNVNLQKYWFKYIKEKVKTVSYISILYEGTESFIKVIIKNHSGGKDTVLFKLTTEPQYLTSNTYEHVLEQLITGSYVEAII